MIGFVFRRILVAFLSFVALIVLCFLLTEVASGPSQLSSPGVDGRAGSDPAFTARLGHYLWNVIATFDLGPSSGGQSVNDILAATLPVTVAYALLALVIAVGLGSVLGIAAALRQRDRPGQLAAGITIGAQTVPGFVLAPILLLIIALWLGWIPGAGDQTAPWLAGLLALVALATPLTAAIARLMCRSMLDVLDATYIGVARAKGLPEHSIVLRHALRPAIRPVLSYLGTAFTGVLAGAIAVDIVFRTGGIGQIFDGAAFGGDPAVLAGLVISVGALALLFRLVIDLIRAWIDPKIGY